MMNIFLRGFYCNFKMYCIISSKHNRLSPVPGTLFLCPSLCVSREHNRPPCIASAYYGQKSELSTVDVTVICPINQLKWKLENFYWSLMVALPPLTEGKMNEAAESWGVSKGLLPLSVFLPMISAILFEKRKKLTSLCRNQKLEMLSNEACLDWRLFLKDLLR